MRVSNKIGMKAIVVGKDYSFGKNREGNIELLQSYAPQYGFEVIDTCMTSAFIAESSFTNDYCAVHNNRRRPFFLSTAATRKRGWWDPSHIRVLWASSQDVMMMVGVSPNPRKFREAIFR